MPVPRAAWLALGLCAASAAARAADEPPLVVFHAEPVDAAVLRALEQAAERSGAALVDLSPRPEPAPEAPILLRRAIEAYHDFRYPDALASADAGLAEAARTGAAGLSATDLSDLLIYRGLAHTEQGDAARAWEDFIRAAALDPARKLDPVRYSPRVVETFGRAVKAVLGSPAATLSVKAEQRCQVWVDGRDTSGQPALSVMRGEHYLRVACPGHAIYGAVILVAALRHEVNPGLRALPVVTASRARAIARERGVSRVVWAQVAPAGSGPPLLTLQLFVAGAARPRSTAAVGLGNERSPAAIAAALERLIRPLPVQAPVLVRPSPPTPWYQKPWVWGIAGAVIASAILIPFVVDSETPSGFDVRPEGMLP
jgi:hypothetical protein